MSEKYKKADTDTVDATKAAIVKLFEGANVEAPDSIKKPKPSKTDMKLLHVGVDHLYMAVLQNLEQARVELEDIVEKKGDERAQKLLVDVAELASYTRQTIDALSEVVEAMPSVEEVQTLFTKLVEEIKLAQVMAIDVPKEKMH